MAINFKKIWEGLTVVPKTTSTADKLGEIEVLSSDNKVRFHNGTSTSPVVTEDHTATLINKTIDADNNTITDLEVDNLKAGVLNTDTSLAGASDTQIPSALAIKTYVDNGLSGQNEASEITYDNATSGLSATNVQDALDEIDANLDAHIADAVDAHDASAISITAIPTIAATEVQGALTELQSDIATVGNDLGAHIVDAVDAHDASAISVVATGNLTSTDAQSALVELQSDIDTRALNTDLTAHTGASSGVHGVTGAVVGTTDTQTLTNKTLTAPVINNGSATGTEIITPARLDSKQDTKANLITYASTATNGQFVFATDEKKMYQIVDNALTAVGGGGQSLDTVFQLFADEELTDWTTGNDATFLNGGTLAGTFAKDSVTPLNGEESYKYTQASGSLNDYIASAAQDVALRFRGQTCTLYFPYQYDGDNDDITPVVYDVTNAAVLISGEQYSLDSTNGGTRIYRANVVIPPTCTQIRVGFQVLVESIGSVLAFDDVQLTADTTVYAELNATNTYSAKIQGVGTVAVLSQSPSFITGIVDNGVGDYTLNFVPGTFTVSPAVTTGSTDSTTQEQDFNVTFPTVNSARIRVVNASNNPVDRNFDIVFNKVGVDYQEAFPTVVTAPESFSTDTASLVYAGSGTYTLSTLANAPVGTFITFTYAASTNTRTQTNAAPTQTTSDMNVNGIRIYSRAFNVLTTSTEPSVIAIQIGKGFKGTNLDIYKSTGKVTGGSLDFFVSGATKVGANISYSEFTGILIIDARYDIQNSSTSGNSLFYFNDATSQDNGYVVINASKSPALVGVPQVQPRIATLSDQKTNGTAGGTSSTGVFQTRTLNTLVDPTGIVTSLSSNQFTLQPGTYYIEAEAVAANSERHKIRIRNITDSTTSLVGLNCYAAQASTAETSAPLFGEIVISSSKTFELQHYIQSGFATNGFGYAVSSGEVEVYATVIIHKIK